MNSNQLNNTQVFSDQEKDGTSIDVKRIVYQAVRYWYIIVSSVLVGLTVAFLINRYATKVYGVKASIIIKESEEVSGGELLYNNPLVKFYRNYLNEIYILKSIPLMERTVTELNFEESFYRIGNLLTTESYKLLPFSVDILENEHLDRLFFKFTLLDNNSYRILYSDDSGEHTEDKQIGETVSIGDISFKLNISDSSLKSIIGQDFAYSYLPSVEVGQVYASRLVAEWAEEGSGVINLSLTGSNPKKEIDFLSGLIKNYQAYDLEKKNETATNTISFINDQLNNISDSLNKAERQLELFKNKNIVTDLNSEALRLYQKMEGLELQKTDLVIRDSYYSYLTDYINKSSDLDQVILPTSVGIADPILTALVSDMMEIQTDIKLLTRSEKLQNPLVTEGSKRMQELKSNILESVKNQKSVDKIKLDFLNKGIREIETQLNYLPVAERQLVNIKRNYALLENLYVFLLQKHAEAGISKASNTTDIMVVNPPIATGAISPIPVRNYVLGFSLGLAVPFLFFFMREFFNTRVQSKEDIEKITNIPFIGGVGHKRTDQNLEVLLKPKSAISESFRALRSNLFYFLQGRQRGVFLISSSISGEGKTFTTVNLSSVFAMSGKKTLIIGADMRRPKIYPDFKLDNAVGLSNYLAGLAEFDQVVRPTEFENLYIVSGGPVPPNPSELILHQRMQVFLENAKSKYDYVFIDSPPLALVTDAFVLSAFVDHTLFIVRQNYTPKDLLRTIDEFYRSGKVKNLSIVLNDIYRSGPGYGYGYNYGYGYGYGYGYADLRQRNGHYYEE